MKCRSVIFALIVTLMSAGLLAAAEAASGKEIFAKKCADCHEASDEGKDAFAKMMKVEMRHLGSKEVQAKSNADLHEVIVKGIGKMRPVKDLDTKSVGDVVDYLRTLAKK